MACPIKISQRAENWNDQLHTSKYAFHLYWTGNLIGLYVGINVVARILVDCENPKTNIIHKIGINLHLRRTHFTANLWKFVQVLLSFRSHREFDLFPRTFSLYYVGSICEFVKVLSKDTAGIGQVWNSPHQVHVWIYLCIFGMHVCVVVVSPNRSVFSALPETCASLLRLTNHFNWKIHNSMITSFHAYCHILTVKIYSQLHTLIQPYSQFQSMTSLYRQCFSDVLP